MISDDVKKTTDALPVEELQQEINKGRQSRFQREKYAYLKTRLAYLTKQKDNEVRQEDVAYKKVVILVSVLGALITLGGLIFEVWYGRK